MFRRYVAIITVYSSTIIISIIITNLWSVVIAIAITV